MNRFNPKVSIVIPVYNGSNYVAEAIDSALAQTYQNIEIIVVNDGSKDDGATDKIAKSYGDKIRYYKKENGGVATALNFGIKKMTGEYFSWLSHDDMYRTNKIHKQIEYLTNLKNRDAILFSNYSVMDENGTHQYNCVLNHQMLEKKPIYALLRGNLNGITMLIPKKAFDDHGDFNIDLRCTQDYDMWYRMMRTYSFVHMKEILSITRVHSLQDTQANPRVVSEGNELWVNMVDGLSDEEKRAAEGTVYKFYFEMTKFLKQTPYNGALSHCTVLLEGSVQSEEAVKEGLNNQSLVPIIFKELISDGQKRAAAYYMSSIVKELVKKKDVDNALTILLANTIGKVAGSNKDTLEKEYISRIIEPAKKPRIMFSSGHWLTGGMERVMSILFDQLKDDYEIFLITAYDGRESKIKLPDYITHIKISNDLFYSSFDVVALSHALTLDINIAIGFMNLFKGQLQFYELSNGTGIKTVASNHETYFYPYSNPNFYDLVKRRLEAYKTVDAALWLTNNSAAAYGLAADNSYLMPNPNTYKAQKSINKSTEKIILCVGRFNDYVKRVDRMLNTFSIVSRKHPDARLVLVGKYDMNAPILPDDERTLAEFIRDSGIDKTKINFVGEVNNVDAYYQRARVLLLTSMNEGFGMVINEAASYGVPTVYNSIPGLEDLITHGENGLSTEQDDINTLAEALDKILSDNDFRNKLAQNSIRLVQRFDENKIGERWRTLLGVLLEGKDINVKLNQHLDYSITDQEGLARMIFTQLNETVSISAKERAEFLEPKYESTTSFITKKAKSKYIRLNRSLKSNGILFTGKLITKKVYRKARRVYKRP
jgi:glycosyltransferase involved in cell wall biosynthesis